MRFLIALIFAGIFLDFMFSFRLPRAAIRSSGAAIFDAGIGLMLLGFGLRWYSITVLGRYFTFDVAIQAKHKIVAIGPYRYIRHPSYTGAIVTMLGFGLALGNWAGMAALIICIAIGYAYRISVEEAALLEAFGAEYLAYMSRTRRLLPFVF